MKRRSVRDLLSAYEVHPQLRLVLRPLLVQFISGSDSDESIDAVFRRLHAPTSAEDLALQVIFDIINCDYTLLVNDIAQWRKSVGKAAEGSATTRVGFGEEVAATIRRVVKFNTYVT